MAMDDTLNLAQAVLVDGRMARPERWENLAPVGDWEEATIIDASVFVSHPEGRYFGTVRYQVDEEEHHLYQRTFCALLSDGWTTIAFRDASIQAIAVEKRLEKRRAARKKPKKRS